ncbi:MAG: hypothetical protein ACKOTD_09690, partial [Phycisphaerales bacterium]
MRAPHTVLVLLAAAACTAAGACQRYPYDPTKATRPYPAQLGQGSLVDHPIAGQIMGSDPDEMARGSEILAGMGYEVIDVNLA